MSNSAVYNRSKSWQIVTYGLLPSITNMFLITMMFANYVATMGYGIPVIMAGVIITGSRVFDAISDPIVGMLGNRVNTRFGKARPLLVGGYIIMAISVLSMLFMGDTGKGLVFYITCYAGYILGTTIFQMGTSVGDVIMTNDPKQRPKIARWSSTYSATLAAFVSFYLSGFLFRKHRGLNMGAFRELGITVCIVGLVLLTLGVIAVWNKDNPDVFNKEYSKKSQSVSIKDCWDLLVKNKAITLMIIARATDKLALQSAGNSAISMLVFGIVVGNYSFNGELRLYSLIPTLIVLYMSTRLAGNKGTRHSYIVWTWIAIGLASSLLIFMLVVDPKTISVSLVPTAAFIIIQGFYSGAIMAGNACTAAITPDLVDYEYYRSGKFMPSPVAAICSFVDKFVSSLATTLVAFAIAFIGYTETMPQATDANTPAVFWMGMLLWLGLPVLGWVASLIAMRWYPLTKEKMEEIQKQNHITRQAYAAEVKAG